MFKHPHSHYFLGQGKWLLAALLIVLSFTFKLGAGKYVPKKIRADSVKIYSCMHSNQESTLDWPCFYYADSMINYSKDSTYVSIKDSLTLLSINRIINRSKVLPHLISHGMGTEENGLTRFNVLFRIYINGQIYDMKCNHKFYKPFLCEICNYEINGHQGFTYNDKFYKDKSGLVDSMFGIYFRQVKKIKRGFWGNCH